MAKKRPQSQGQGQSVWKRTQVLVALITTAGVVVAALIAFLGRPTQYPEPTSKPTDEYVALLENRAQAIVKELSDQELTFAISDFTELHRSNVKALRDGQLIASHELTAQIHKLLTQVWEPERALELYSQEKSPPTP